MDEDDRYDFDQYVTNNSIYNPHIMFITKPEILKNWFPLPIFLFTAKAYFVSTETILF